LTIEPRLGLEKMKKDGPYTDRAIKGRLKGWPLSPLAHHTVGEPGGEEFVDSSFTRPDSWLNGTRKSLGKI